VAVFPYDVRVGPSSGTTPTGYHLTQEVDANLHFVAITSHMHTGGPDITSGDINESPHRRRVRESLDRSIRENATIWQELSKR